MNRIEIKQYVENYLNDASLEFLSEIVAHGIFNTSADIVSPENKDEMNDLANEFYDQAKAILDEQF